MERGQAGNEMKSIKGVIPSLSLCKYRGEAGERLPQSLLVANSLWWERQVYFHAFILAEAFE